MFVSFNELTELPDEIGDLENLEMLVLTQNKLVNLPQSIGKLKKLEVVQLAYNRLKNLPNEMTNCTSLRMLDLEMNWMESFPDSVQNWKNLRDLNLVNCGRLVHIPESFCELRQLELLRIDPAIVVPTCLLVRQNHRLKIEMIGLDR